MVTKLYLIRHGETEDAQPKRYKGHMDVPLSEKGIKQMERLSAFLSQNTDNPPNPPLNKGGQGGVTAVYCSDLSRAVRSAEIIAEPHGLKPIIVPELKERNFGTWEGMTFNEIKEKYPQEFEAWASNPLKFSPMQGESTIEVNDRAIGALNRILSNHMGKNPEHRAQNTDPPPPRPLPQGEGESIIVPSPSRGEGKGGGENLSSENIAIVSHGGINRIVLCHFLEMPLENIFRIEQDYGALNILEFYDNYPVVKLINYIV